MENKLTGSSPDHIGSVEQVAVKKSRRRHREIVQGGALTCYAILGIVQLDFLQLAKMSYDPGPQDQRLNVPGPSHEVVISCILSLLL